MARVYKFAQKEFGIASELLTLQGQSDASFTYNGKQVLTLGAGGNVHGARIVSTTPIVQNAVNGANSLLTWASVTLNSPSSGISLPSNIITIGRAGAYTVTVQIDFNGAYAGGTFGGGIVNRGGTAGTDTYSISNVDQGAGVDRASCTFCFFKTTGTIAVPVLETFSLTLNGIGVGGTNTGYSIIQNVVDIVYNEFPFV